MLDKQKEILKRLNRIEVDLVALENALTGLEDNEGLIEEAEQTLNHHLMFLEQIKNSRD